MISRNDERRRSSVERKFMAPQHAPIIPLGGDCPSVSISSSRKASCIRSWASVARAGEPDFSIAVTTQWSGSTSRSPGGWDSPLRS